MFEGDSPKEYAAKNTAARQPSASGSKTEPRAAISKCMDF
jgi:hypothetical protein